MKKRLAISLSLILCNFLSAQNNNISFKDKIEENNQFKTMVKNALLVNDVSLSKNFKNFKSSTLERFQYEMEWDTASSNWDTLVKYTYYSNQITAGIVEYSGYINYFTPNSTLRRDSVYMKVDSNLNVYKIPFNFFGDYVSVFQRFSIDTITNQYRMYSEDSITSNSMGNITRSSYSLHDWNPGQPTTIDRLFTYDIYYTGNGPVNYWIERTKNFLGSGYLQDSISISADNNHYPLNVTVYEKLSLGYKSDSKYIYTYNSNHNPIRIIYQIDNTGQGNFTTVTENKITFVNGLKKTDSLLGSSGSLQRIGRYYYNNNLLDSVVSTSYTSNPPSIEYWNRYEYDTLNRLTLRTYLYPTFGNYLQGNRTWYDYSLLNTSIQEREVESKNKISIYPNPTNDKIFIDGEFSENRLQIRNISGKLIKEFNSIRPSEIIRLDDLPSGAYFLHFESGETRKLIKQ